MVAFALFTESSVGDMTTGTVTLGTELPAHAVWHLGSVMLE
jgi:hypothetical protein